MRPADGSAAARSWARPYPARYQAASAPVATARVDFAATAATPTVPASVLNGRAGVAPDTSRRDNAVTVYVCAATVSAAGTALRTSPPLAPSSTSSPRHTAIIGGPAAVFLAQRSYTHTAPASGTATAAARFPPVSAATATPATVSPAAAAKACPGRTRPDGIGRWGRSTASSSRSAQSLAAMPPQ